jgi:eukaryotic-like serine/threonine-protein kinase
MPLQPGTRLGPYEITSAIGHGGMGEVYQARDLRLHRDVAVKTLPAEVASQADRLWRFEQEARAIAALSHPHVLAIFDVGQIDDVHYLVTELLEGETLRQRLVRGPLDYGMAVEIARQIAAGLASAHARGIVHRDLKPDNVFLTRDGFAKVLDFGLAKVASGAGSLRDDLTQTATGVALGTIGYMAPEQVAGRDVDPRTDVFAVGVVLFEALSGRRAADALSGEALDAVLGGRPLDLGLAETPLAGPIGRIVRRCLERDPADRYQSMADLRQALDALPSSAADASSRREPPDTPSIAVLPFADMSREQSQAYFCEGMAEEIINALARAPGLRVAARTSTFETVQAQAARPNLAAVARALRVRTVLEGSVRTAGERLRVTAQLIDPLDGHALWSDKFDGSVADVFDIQDRIASAIVKALRIKLLGDRQARLPARQTDNLEAYHAYLKGRHHRFTTYDLLEAHRAFQQAASLDPSYASAHAGVAYTLIVLGNYGFVPPQAARSQALAAVERALAIDPRLAQAHAARAYLLLMFDHRWDEAERLLSFALELDPNDIEARVFFGYLYAVQRREEDARRQLALACELEPFSAWTRAVTGMALLNLGDVENARVQAAQALEVRPDSLLAQAVLGTATSLCGQTDEGIALLERAVAVAPAHHWIRCALGAAYAAGSRVDEAEGVIRTLEARRSEAYVSPGWLALVHAGLGRTDEAIRLLELEVDSGGAVVTFLWSPVFTRLRQDPRFQAMLRQLGLPPGLT